MLHLLGGLLKPAKGSIHLGGQDFTSLQGSKLDKFRGKNIGIIFQESHFVRSLTVEENLKLARQLAGLKPDAEKIKHVLRRLNIQDKAHVKPHRLSVGEQQRANICRALVNDPQLILADEPTSALDDHNCTEVVNLLTQQAEADQITLLIVTHDNRLKRIFQNQINLNT